ncbi:MAG: glutamyl-tRNA reductase [Ignavibacteria bacterium]|nr:glutamyl-tRNA reductase [Ignavibacteria bacterium]
MKFEDKIEGNQILVLCGINYKTSNVETRELFQIPKNDLIRALNILKNIEGVDESLILTTCGRIEFYLVLNKSFNPEDIINTFYLEFNGLDLNSHLNNFYFRHGTSVARHLFRVICGLDSLVLGEYQIQGQVKDAYSAACSASNPGKILHRLFHFAFRTGKYIRTETSIGKTNLSIAALTNDILKENVVISDRVAFIGANENIKIIAHELSKSGFKNLIFFNRTVTKAQQLTDNFGGCACSLENLPELIGSANAIVSCTGAPGFILKSEDIAKIYDSSDLKVIIDLGMPRNIEIPDNIKTKIKILNMENINIILKIQDKNIELETEFINNYIEEQILTFIAWFNGRNNLLSIFCSEQIEQIRLQTIREFGREIPEQSKELFDVFSKTLSLRILTIVNKINKKKLQEKLQ